MKDANENCLLIDDVREKIRLLPQNIEAVWSKHNISIPKGTPGRDVKVEALTGKSQRRKLTDKNEQAKLLHALANIELQAMELAFRSFVEYPDAPIIFREQMADLALSEAQHLALCLDQLDEMKFQWGSVPVHMNLWSAVSTEDSLLDRIVIVHRYLEACGLDSGAALHRRIVHIEAPHVAKAVKQITEDEVGHVAFGSYWYKELCRLERLDPDEDFKTRMHSLKTKLPRRVEALDRTLRMKAGFTESELEVVEQIRQHFLGTRQRPVELSVEAP